MARERTADRNGKKTILSGMDSVSSMIPLATSYDAPEASDWQLIGIKNVIDSAVEAGVGHFVLFSANSANWALNRNLANKFQMEEYARDKGLRSTLLRPVAYMENFVRFR